MEKSEKKKKEYEFALLKRRPMWQRVDLVAVSIITSALLYQFGW